MILLELFAGTYQLRQLDAEEIGEQLGELMDEGDIARAYEFWTGPKKVVIYFAATGDGVFDCSFAEISNNPRDYRFKFVPTGTGDQFKVYGAVAQCIREFIDEFHPAAITMLGTTPQQSSLYQRAIKRVQFPSGYEAVVRSGYDTVTIVRQDAA